MKKKWLITAISILLLVSITACASQVPNANQDSSPVSSTAAAEPSESTAPSEPMDTTPTTTPPETTPPVTEPPATEPPVTAPPATEPPVTTPPATVPPATKPPATEPSLPSDLTEAEQIEAIIDGMTLEEKIYQLFIVTGEDITGGKTLTAVDGKTKTNLAKYPVGGIIFFASNLKDPQQTKTMLADLQKESLKNTGLPLFTCVDEEGGRVARIANNPAFGVPKFGGNSTIQSVDEAYRMGKTIGSYLAELGFNFNFAPVADPTTDGIESHVQDRSFGNDPEFVAQCAVAVSKGLTEHDVLSSFKHFPGNGASATDPHKDFAYTSKTRDELMSHDLIPFMEAQENGVPAIMVAHITAQSLSGDDTPSSLSYPVITELLRGELGYEGLVLTDALNMGAIVKKYGPDEAAVMALKAGNDLILMPDDFSSAVDAIMDAVESGEITESRIDESLRRIIAAKLK